MRLKQWMRASSVVENLPANAGDMGSIPAQEDSTCHGATKPVCHNYCTCALEPGNCSYWAHMPQLLKPTCPRAHAPQQKKHHNEKPMHCSEEEPLLTETREKPTCRNKDPAQPKISQQIKLS